MTRKQDSANKTNWKELIGEQEDFLRPIIRKVLDPNPKTLPFETGVILG